MSLCGGVTIQRPFPPDRTGDLWRWLNTPRAPNFDDFGARDRAEFEGQFTGRLAQEFTWGIRASGELIGYLAFLPQTPVAGMFHGLVIAPHRRGSGIGTLAVAQAIDELRKAGFQKLIVWTFADNEPIRHVFGKLGFVQEGYITAATRRGGEPLDMRVLCRPGTKGAEVCHSVDC